MINPIFQTYAEYLTSPEDELLHDVNEYTARNHPEYQMLSGHLQGKFLEMISRMLQPRFILEIGTFTGYSGLCLVKGLVRGGEFHTIELREETAGIAKRFFQRSSRSDQIILHTGNALNILPELSIPWDLVFIDADKVSYSQYFELVLPQVRKNGFILADNIFFHGEVLASEVKGKNAKAIRDFNEFIREREDIDKVVITLRDGLYLIRKL